MFLKAIPVMIREERYLEVETFSTVDMARKDRLGESLKAFGRRLTDLSEEFIPGLIDQIKKEMTQTKVLSIT